MKNKLAIPNEWILCILIILGHIFNSCVAQDGILKQSKIPFELDIEIDLFDFPTKVVVLQINQQGHWDTTFTSTILSGNGTVKGVLSYEDYVQVKLFPTDNPKKLVAQQNLILGKGKSYMKWNNETSQFEVGCSALNDSLNNFFSQRKQLGKQHQEVESTEAKDALDIELLTTASEFYYNNTNNVIGAFILSKYLSTELEVEEVEKNYSLLSARVKTTGWGMYLKNQIEKMKVLQVGKPMPTFKAEALNSTTVQLSNYKGKVVLVDFWASWCGPCVKELKYLCKLDSMYDDSQFEIISISRDKTMEKLDQAIVKYNMNWTHIWDKDLAESLTSKYNIAWLPSCFILDKKGTIVAKNLRGEELIETVTNTIYQ